MTSYETITTIINIIAVIVAPIAAVRIGQKLQDKAQVRKDKMEIFRCLMSHRIAGWTSIENVNALNTIDIVFADCEPVRQQWKVLLSKYRPEISPLEINREQCKLLELMANDLGYKDTITWNEIQNPYYPEGLSSQINANTQIMKGQVEWAKAAEAFASSMMNNNVK